MTNLYQIEIRPFPSVITVTAETKEEAQIKAREEYRNSFSIPVASTKVLSTEKF